MKALVILYSYIYIVEHFGLNWLWGMRAVGSPVSANKPDGRDNKVKGATTTSGSSREPSDEDDEGGLCEQSTNAIETKRLRRYIQLRYIVLCFHTFTILPNIQ